MAADACPFCELIASGNLLLRQTPASVAFDDAFPVSAGHLLVVPRRHVADLGQLHESEWLDLNALALQMTREIAAAGAADGFNLGVNSGAAAGQTVDHLHLHVIPRRAGDHPDPRGGIRWVLPEQARYWRSAGDS